MYLIAFVGGLLTVLSPCILPVVPFLFAGAQRQRSSILLTLVGMALTFALISSLAVVSSEWVIQASNTGRHVALGVMALFALSAEDKHVTLSLRGDAWVTGDRLMIQRAISNLLSNAIRHTPEGSSVLLLVETYDQSVALSVGNPGRGIEAHHLPHLFERFYRADSSRTRAEGGTGLGLAIVQSIMQLHQGHADVSSQPGRFTRFSLVFPLHLKTAQV